MALKRILLYSGGLDSFILKMLFHISDKECLFVRMGTEENKIEEHFLDIHNKGITKVDLPISRFSLENDIIPFRNHMLGLLGAQFGNAIYFGFTAGDTTKDKDYVFKAQMEGLLNYFATSPDKVKIQGPYTIEMPLKPFTKAQLVEKYLKSGYNPIDLIEKSRSCYSGTQFGCGICRSCLRKFVAIKICDPILGERLRNSFDNNPVELLPSFLKESIDKGRGDQETKEIELCMNLS